MKAKKFQERRGTATVEFAIVAPVLLLILIAVLEFWRINTMRHVAHQAAYQASRQGVIPGGWGRWWDRHPRNRRPGVQVSGTTSSSSGPTSLPVHKHQ